MLLSGYGSYGVSNDPSFSREDIPLMDRGVVIAVAHIRGGQGVVQSLFTYRVPGTRSRSFPYNRGMTHGFVYTKHDSRR